MLSCDIDISAVYNFLQPTAAKVSISGHIDTQYLSLVLTVILRLNMAIQLIFYYQKYFPLLFAASVREKSPNGHE